MSCLHAVAAGLLGCAQAEPATQLLVTVAGDEDVLRKLGRIDAKLYETDAQEGAAPVAKHTFQLPATTPLSFGVERGEAERFVLVIEGYESDDGRSQPFIEQKRRAHFEDGNRLQLDVFLARECFRLTSPCLTLGRTCRADARACEAVPDAVTAKVVPGETRTAGAPTRPPVASACAQNACTNDYPCVPTTGAGHTCLGQFADWPMPDPTPGAARAPRYEPTEELVKDVVTGLTWQRRTPAPYPGCTGVSESAPISGSSCTLDEAKVYCHELTIGGLAWRLPSKIELESLLDPTASSFAIPRDLFPGCEGLYWTGSPLVSSSDAPRVSYYVVDPEEGTSSYWDVARASCVRCVSGSPIAAGTPADRYRKEPDGAVLDARTRLRWQPTVSDPLETLEAAAAYCSAQRGGHRLPTLKELLTLVDPTRVRPAIDPIFGDTPWGGFWATQGTWAARSPRVVSFATGVTYPVGGRVSIATNAGHPRARCVR